MHSWFISEAKFLGQISSTSLSLLLCLLLVSFSSLLFSSPTLVNMFALLINFRFHIVGKEIKGPVSILGYQK